MVAPGLGSRSPCRQLAGLRARDGTHFLHAENATGQRSGLVEHHGVHMRDGVQAIPALEQNPLAGGRPDAAKVAQRDADHQRTRA